MMEASKNQFEFDESKDMEEEQLFVKLFHNVLQENRGKLTDDEIGEGVIEAIEKFQRGPANSCNRGDYNNLQSLCGFFYRFSPLFARTTRNRFFFALRDCEELSSCFNKSSLKIVDAGCGAGSALVGFFSALYEGRFRFESLQVIGIDYNKYWESFFNEIIRKLGEDNFGNASRLLEDKTINTSFLEADLLKYDWSELDKADIILMKGFLSVLSDDSERLAIFREIASKMIPMSILVIIESPAYMKGLQAERLRFVFTTMESKKSDSENEYRFRGEEIARYGPGLALKSNQQLYVYQKK